ncbi:pre-mRNA splicing factor ATP-dependent RNA helicase [Strigomonas culicis]|uniref:Pre-mRNA splicing factor ATP-dependent RNA helicase n=1 Tax=Strigomonas culicis TaxID=28005 RepID=S9UXQ6_9TRYP|nr:pre-mRNA splicing factor ATP-dependent RNA helicase [Strigomonas culicis]|eukprot:EPY35637.1 pre-mRNA splicing factor ATP-dependent RNA helicase [Strigomonas culicis]
MAAKPLLDDEALLEQRSLAVLRQLQEICCKNELYGQLEFMMGHSTNAEEYYDDVDGLVELYMEKTQAFDEQQVSATEGKAADAEKQKEAFVVDAFESAINGEASEEEPDIPHENLRRLYHTLHAALDASNLETGLAVGALEAAAQQRKVEEEEARAREQLSAAEAERLTATTATRRAAMKVSPEEMFRMAQHVRSGLADEAELLTLQQEDDGGAEVAVELNESEPKFLQRLGLRSMRRRINYRALLPSEQLRNARTTLQRQSVLDRLAQRQQGDTSNMNSMELAAVQQLKINADRRIIHRRAQQQQEQQQQAGEEEAAVASPVADGGLLHTELDEKLEEHSFARRTCPRTCRRG